MIDPAYIVTAPRAHVVQTSAVGYQASVAVPFSAHKPSMMVATIALAGAFDIHTVFHLLPITHVDVIGLTRMPKRIDIPLCGTPGAILSARISVDKVKRIRGLVRSNTEKAFENSITLDIETTNNRSVCAKVSASKIHIAGAHSVECNWDVARRVVAAIKKVQEHLTQLNRDVREGVMLVAWIINHTRGACVRRGDGSDHMIVVPPTASGVEIIDEQAEYRRAGFTPDCIAALLAHPPPPAALNPAIAAFLISKCVDQYYHSEYVGMLLRLLTIDHVHTPDFGLVEDVKLYESIMINYSLDLNIGWINRQALADLFRATPFHVEYRPDINHSVKLLLPYTKLTERKVEGKRKMKTPTVTIITHRSGKIIISAGSVAIAAIAYNLFLDHILRNPIAIAGVAHIPRKKAKAKTIHGVIIESWMNKYLL